jgi:hypothetical protein
MNATRLKALAGAMVALGFLLVGMIGPTLSAPVASTVVCRTEAGKMTPTPK